MLKHQQITNGQTFDTAYTYNLSGALIEETYPSGRKVLNTLDVNGDLSQVQTKTSAGSYQNRASNLTYLSHGGVKSLMLGNSRWENAQYNNRLQITQIGMGTTSTDTSMLKIDYDYGTSTQNNGSLKEQTIAFSGYSGTIVQSYTYDNLNRIQSTQENYSGGLSWKETFSYDRFGNRRFDHPKNPDGSDAKGSPAWIKKQIILEIQEHRKNEWIQFCSQGGHTCGY